MTPNPYLHALLAALYLALIATLFFYGPAYIGPDDNVLLPVSMLSLFVLSAALMAYLFLYEPVRLLTEGRAREAILFFFKTVGAFALLTFLCFALAFAGTWRGEQAQTFKPTDFASGATLVRGILRA